ncbi:iron chelate uptake ABC transporter family permease subunit [Modestobacter sp. VKM Ac-2983]|uniref:iron chelate uptake ABC transporter family permease subunit n=1 Tax=Modestobacter sp. VKM Ac-2983 TaxID=3004137 RepID=UPI0022AB812A|nr:iron chelate uptake ABC transporter family permease subunit [Modestobacter sp. VKM Ac-2983]MCZ2806856.1 iron chelate uptake ABC transporter family permease subunit [Modestobacter sp. VKM Ac-2983]
MLTDPRATESGALPAAGLHRTRLAASWASPRFRLTVLGAVVLALIAGYLFTGVPGSLAFALRIRGLTVLAMLVVATAVGVSTVVFHTITQNRILTPSIMGFDAFYVLISTLIVFSSGSAAFLALDQLALWLVQVVVMVAFSVLLFTWLFGGKRRSIHLMLLVGIVLGTFFRSLSEWMQRMLDPLDFQVLTDAMFASLTRPDETLLALTACLVALGCAVVVPLLRTLDVLTLGEPAAVGLGVDHKRVVMVLFVGVSVMIAASTALVGPILFFGLIVANLAYSYVGSFRHVWTLPAAVGIGMVCLLGGQLVLERLFGFGGALSMVIDFAGGLFFLYLVLRKGAR